jgi:hypothetical protein
MRDTDSHRDQSRNAFPGHPGAPARGVMDVNRSQARRARCVPDRVNPDGDSRSLVVRRAKMPQISVSAGRPWIVDETSQADSAGSIPVTRSTPKAQGS